MKCEVFSLSKSKKNLILNTSELVTKTGLNLIPYQLENDVSYAKTLYNSLAELCKNSKVMETYDHWKLLQRQLHFV